jgi:hypothetical protein
VCVLCCWVSASDSNSSDSVFRRHCPISSCFFQSLQAYAGMHLRIVHISFLPHPLQFTVHYHPFLWHHVVWARDSIVQ